LTKPPVTTAARTVSSKELYPRLLRHVFPYWRVFLLGVLGMAISAATEPGLPYLLKPLLDSSFVNKDPQAIRVIPLLIIALFLVRGIAGYASTYALSWVGGKLVMDMRNLMFDKLVKMPTRYYDNTSSGAVIANIAFNMNQVADAGVNVITVIVKDSVTVIGLLGLMLYQDWKLTLVALTVTPIIVFIVRVFSTRLRHMSRSAQRSVGDITHVLEETLGGHKVVKIFGGQEYESRRFFDATNRIRRFNMKQTTAAAANVPLVQMVVALALSIIIYYATLKTDLTVGGFVAFITAMLMLLAPIKRLTGVNESLQKGLAAAELVFDMLDEPAEPDAGTLPLQRARGELEFDDVSLVYDEAKQPALDHFSLKIPPGETVALVGASGSGKTSLANLIPRFYHPTQGRILLDGQDIEAIRLIDLREQIAFVSQDVVLFNDTVAANIAYGRQNQASEQQIVAAAEAAHAMEFIRQMPRGLQTLVGENGVKLSGGQRQRIAIARALLKNAPILILDEATSALDTQSERHVQAALETLMQGRTTIVIAHRLSTVEKADRIVVLQKGRIVEQGRHAELLEQNGTYAHLYRLQFAERAQS
jgi:subfamily B ATP-binding cassette protein MsbA